MAKRQYMSFQDWITFNGVNKISELLGVERATVRHWRTGHCHPRVEQMRAIKKLSKGAVGYEQIIDGPANRGPL